MKALKATIATLGLLVALGAAAYGIADHLFNQELKSRFDRQLASMEDKMVVSYDRFHYSLFTRQGQARGIIATTTDGRFRLLLDRLVIHRIDRDPETDNVTSLRLSGHGVRLREHRDGGQDEGFVPAFSDLGYNDPRMEFLIDYAFAPASQSLTIHEGTVSGLGMGHLDLEAELSGIRSIDLGQISAGNLLQVAAAVGSLRFHGATIEYTDEGFAKKMLARREATEGVTRAEIVAATRKSMQEQRFFRFSEAMTDAVTSFLQNPEHLTIVSAPSQPVGREVIGMTLLFRGNLLQVFGVTIVNGARG